MPIKETEIAAASVATPAANKKTLFLDTDGAFKTKDESGTVASLTGATGATGATGPAGATWSNGTAAPSGGSDGDYYLKTDDDEVYKKIAGVWTLIWTAPSGGSGGKIAQVVNTQTGAAATGTTTIPLDDTLPQNSEGTELLSLAITPTSAINKLRIDVVIFLASNTAARWLIAALFQDSTASALAAGEHFEVTADTVIPISFTHYMTSGTTSATTFKVRAGAHSAATITRNGNAGSRLLGGAFASSITITEIVP